MSGIYYQYDIIITSVDGRKSCNTFRFFARANTISANLLCDVKNGPELLAKMDALTELPCFTDPFFCAETKTDIEMRQQAIKTISAYTDFSTVAHITINEDCQWDDGASSHPLIVLNNKNCPAIPRCASNKADALALADWRKHYKFSFNPSLISGNLEGFNKRAVISGYRSSATKALIPRYLRYHKVTHLGKNAFKQQEHLTEVIIPEGVLGINSQAFNQCANLRKITLPSSLTFVDPSFLVKCPQAMVLIPEDSVAISALQKCNIPYEIYQTPPYDYISEINTFLKYKPLPVVKTPKKLPKAPEAVPIADITYPPCQPEDFLVTSGVLKKYKGAGGILDLSVIPRAFFKIGFSAFSDCVGIQSVIIPTGVKKIDPYAFSKCKNLRSVSFSNDLETIERCAFNCCRKLESVDLPNSVKSIDSDAFSYCSSLSSIVIPETCMRIGSSCFQGCSNLSSVIFKNGDTSVDVCAFSGCKKLTIYAPAGSNVESYAQYNNIPFVAVPSHH